MKLYLSYNNCRSSVCLDWNW